ncbi:OmpA family protein [Zunongwangia sp. F363]|uniref:OmpA family protein n=1 Tax=Autumnicola tepida TaxID=3075595 RepID=A0ABU3C9H4_9FLAO|nr:OmpA family protein [Zunongwangia sp. F363]MDT0642984.1 OmpA family protein [Zunongwangia sp. F363]
MKILLLNKGIPAVRPLSHKVRNLSLRKKFMIVGAKNKLLMPMAVFLMLPWLFFAQYEEEQVAEGSFLINMGIVPQNFGNALKPYGLIYELLEKEPVEIKWVINPEKKKDGIDFVHDSVQYRGGTFVIPVSYINPQVKQRIESWIKKGVIGDFSDKNLRLPVFTTLSIAPKWTLDKQNGNIALPFFKAAGIPAEAHGGDSSAQWKSPEELGVCDDIFVMPHAEPKFSTHQNLYYWNQDFKGAIWAGCHAGSQLENLLGPVKPSEATENGIIQLNFLSSGFAGASSAGLIPFYEHRHATPPYTHRLPADPVSQYMGSCDEAHLNGSERVFYPKAINLWRPGTRKIVVDESAPDNPELTKGEAAVVVYGHGFDNPDNGLVMYQAAHSIYGDKEANVAAMRAFFNWSFYAAEIKRRENIIKFEDNASGESIVAARVGDDLAKLMQLRNILFDLDKAEIRAEAKEELDRIVKFMKEFPELLLDIRSHTDCRADDIYNLKLSEDRVEATINYLVNHGIRAKRISGRGYGETEVLNECINGIPCSEKKHEVNRRSEFILSVDCRVYSAKLKQSTK